MKWQNLHFSKIVRDVTGGQKKIQKKTYLSQGQIPVVDQGQQLFSGYTNDETALFNKNIPVVIFGDHTRIVKYIDFPFALGADGVKVLETHGSLLPKFFYYYCQSIAIPSRGYSRHFKFLKNINIPLPPPSEQGCVVEILDQADRLRNLRADSDDKAQRILPALFTKMFGDPATNPMGWPVRKMGSLAVDLRYGTSIKCSSEEIGLPVLRIPNVVKGRIDLNNIKFGEPTKNEINNLMLKQGDILFVRTNGNRDYVGRCAVFDLDGNYIYASYLIRARLFKEKVDPKFVVSYLSTPTGQKAMAPFIRTTAGQSNISQEGLKQIPISLPPIEKQKIFCRKVEESENLFNLRFIRFERIELLFTILLHRAFTGDLTASWRKAHMKELLQEMEIQAKALAS